MKQRTFLLKSVLFVQIIALMICTVASVPFSSLAQTTTTAPSSSIEDVLTDSDLNFVQVLQDQRNELQQQAATLQEEREKQTNSLAGLLEKKDSIQKQIALKQQEIDINTQISESLTAQIHRADIDMIRAEQAMLVRRQTLLERFEVLRQKVRALSKGGQYTALQLIFSSESFESLLINLKMAERIVKADQSVLSGLEEEFQSLRTERDGIFQKQRELEEQLAPYENAEQDLASAKEELLGLYNEAAAVSNQLSANVSYLHMQYVNLTNQQMFVQNQISQVIGNYDTEGIVAPTTMHWPSPECPIITSSYKLRRGKWHYGLDIASWGDATGKQIVAAADGTVIFSGSDDSGYGNYVIIDHGHDIFGQRIVTMYAHCHVLYAQAGDKVIGGQTAIAAVGNTGRSEGAHLHFEVRVNGNAVDPIANGYLSLDGITVAG